VAKDRWTEINIGPFYVDTNGDTGAARDVLTQLEQLRWVLGGLLESKDLGSVWPIRVLLTQAAKTNPIGFVPQDQLGGFVLHGQRLLVMPPNGRLPLEQIAGMLLADNTPRLPHDVESGLVQLLGTIKANGSRVSWGGSPPHPDLAWARIQLFATKFEYYSSFHIFLNAAKSATIRVAEQNAFGRDSAVLEKEAAANLAAGTWQPVAVSGRPLDPKRDFGEHTTESALMEAYLADAQLAADRKAAEATYKSAVQAGSQSAAAGYEGLVAVALLEHGDGREFMNNAIKAGSKSPPVYVLFADGLPDEDALAMLKRATVYNPRWAEPIVREANLKTDLKEQESLLQQATKLDPRNTSYWIELAKVQTRNGHASLAQGSWLRAEDSAPEGAERDRVHQLRLDSEQERLDAADEARQREREAVHLADERAKSSAESRVKASEERANKSLDAQAGGERPQNVIPWHEMASGPPKKLIGTLIQVDCGGAAHRLSIRDRSGSVIKLLLSGKGTSSLPCGVQKPAPRVLVTYAAAADQTDGTAGSILSMQVQ
jgi:hypothetical protein